LRAGSKAQRLTESQEKRKAGELPRLRLGKGRAGHHGPQIVSKKGRESQDKGAPVPVAAATATDVATPGSTPLLMAQERELRAKLKELRDHIVKTRQCRRALSQRSAENALRRYRASPIYGEASPEEARSLIDEGVEVSPLRCCPTTGIRATRHCEPTGRRRAPPDDRLREAIHGAANARVDCFVATLLGRNWAW